MYVNATVARQGLMRRRVWKMLPQMLLCVVGLLASFFSNAVLAEARFAISKVEVVLVDKVYYLSAQIDYELSDKVLEVMHKGVSIVMVLDIEFLRSRKYLWNEAIARLVQRYRLEYHALTRQYLITNLNSGSQHSFPTLEVALMRLGRVIDLPVLDQKLTEERGQYIGLMRVAVDVSELPTPLRLRAYFSSDWHLTSEWYSWILPH